MLARIARLPTILRVPATVLALVVAFLAVPFITLALLVAFLRVEPANATVGLLGTGAVVWFWLAYLGIA